MRKSMVMCVLMITLALSGCGGARDNDPQQQALAFRAACLEAKGCTAELTVTADYGQRVYTYDVEVTVTDGESVLTVNAPTQLAGITARLTRGESSLEYDGAVLETGPLSEDGLTPLSAVPALLEYARSGFIDSCGADQLGEQAVVRILCRDPETPAGQGQEATIWFDPTTNALLQGEISVDGHRMILCELKTFVLN